MAKGSRQQKKKCVKPTAFPCKFTCLPRRQPSGKLTNCRNPLKGQAATAVLWVADQERRLKETNEKRSKRGLSLARLENNYIVAEKPVKRPVEKNAIAVNNPDKKLIAILEKKPHEMTEDEFKFAKQDILRKLSSIPLNSSEMVRQQDKIAKETRGKLKQLGIETYKGSQYSSQGGTYSHAGLGVYYHYNIPPKVRDQANKVIDDTKAKIKKLDSDKRKQIDALGLPPIAFEIAMPGKTHSSYVFENKKEKAIADSTTKKITDTQPPKDKFDNEENPSWFREDGGINYNKVSQFALENSKYGKAFTQIEDALKKTGDRQNLSKFWQQVRFRFDEGLPLLDDNDFSIGKFKGTGLTKALGKKIMAIKDDYHPLIEKSVTELKSVADKQPKPQIADPKEARTAIGDALKDDKAVADDLLDQIQESYPDVVERYKDVLRGRKKQGRLSDEQIKQLEKLDPPVKPTPEPEIKEESVDAGYESLPETPHLKAAKEAQALPNDKWKAEDHVAASPKLIKDAIALAKTMTGYELNRLVTEKRDGFSADIKNKYKPIFDLIDIGFRINHSANLSEKEYKLKYAYEQVKKNLEYAQERYDKAHTPEQISIRKYRSTFPTDGMDSFTKQRLERAQSEWDQVKDDYDRLTKLGEQRTQSLLDRHNKVIERLGKQVKKEKAIADKQPSKEITKTFKKGSYEVSVDQRIFGSDKKKVDGDIRGDYGVHANPEAKSSSSLYDGEVVLTHIPSGLAIATLRDSVNYKNKAERVQAGKILANELIKLGVDFGDVSKLSPEERKEINVLKSAALQNISPDDARRWNEQQRESGSIDGRITQSFLDWGKGKGNATPKPSDPKPASKIMSSEDSAKERSYQQRNRGKFADVGNSILSHFADGGYRKIINELGSIPRTDDEGVIRQIQVGDNVYNASLWMKDNRPTATFITPDGQGMEVSIKTKPYGDYQYQRISSNKVVNVSDELRKKLKNE